MLFIGRENKSLPTLWLKKVTRNKNIFKAGLNRMQDLLKISYDKTEVMPIASLKNTQFKLKTSKKTQMDQDC